MDTSHSVTDTTYHPAPPNAVLLDGMEADAWNQLSLDEKLAWLYDASHRAIEENLHLFPNHLTMATEELDEPAAIRRVAQFVNPGWRQFCPPVHLNHVLHESAAEPAATPLLATQNAMADFDLHQMNASDTYPVIYFLQRMIADHNTAEQDEAISDLETLRGEITTLVNRAEGQMPAAPAQQTGSGAPNLQLIRGHGLSEAQTARLDDFFHDFEPDKLEASTSYPVIYFLQRLMALREVTGDGDPELAATYRFMGDQVDALIQKAAEAG